MLAWMCRCPACGLAAEAAAFPLCSPCLKSLVRAPALCVRCLGPGCAPDACLRPWASFEETPFASVGATYLSIGPGHAVLKAWKKIGGPLFDRIVLIPDAEASARWPLGATICPMPQGLRRSWALGRSPAERLAIRIAELRGGRIDRGLVALPRLQGTLRQAERSLEGRIADPPRFRHPGRLAGPVLLVDDFLTSGRTLRSAVRALALAGAGEVHAFVLGVRPRLGGEGRESESKRTA